MADGRLLVLLPTWIGDAVMATPLLRRVRELRPGWHLTLAGAGPALELFRASPRADAVVDLDGGAKGRRGLIGTIGRIRRRAAALRAARPDEVLLLPGSLSSGVAAWLAGVPARLGYAREGRGLLLTRSLRHPPDFRTRHRVAYFLDLARLLGPSLVAPGDDPTPASDPLELALDERARTWAAGFLEGAPRGEPLIALHAGATYGASKCWTAEGFVETLAAVRARLPGLSVLVVGGPDERASADRLLAALGERQVPATSAAGATPGLLELAALLQRADLVLSTDSGPMHVAAALGRPQVAVFTSTSPAFTSPWHRAAAVVRSKVACAPCFARDCPRAGQAPGGRPRCHEDVLPLDVAEACLARLAAR